jgi:hypothetical protein
MNGLRRRCYRTPGMILERTLGVYSLYPGSSACNVWSSHCVRRINSAKKRLTRMSAQREPSDRAMPTKQHDRTEDHVPAFGPAHSTPGDQESGIDAPDKRNDDRAHGKVHQKKQPPLPPADVSSGQKHEQSQNQELSQHEQNQAAAIDVLVCGSCPCSANRSPDYVGREISTCALLKSGSSRFPAWRHFIPDGSSCMRISWLGLITPPCACKMINRLSISITALW